MKTINISPITGHNRIWLLAINFLALIILSSCSSSNNNSDPDFTPSNTLEGKVFVLGAQVDNASGDLVLYANGTDLDGAVLSIADLQTATVSVGATDYTTGDTELTITAVGAGDDFISLGLVTDYSNSTNGELQFVAGIFTDLLDNMPLVYEAQVMTFSDEYEVHATWTDDLAALKTAVATVHSVRNKTALYDSMGVALEGDVDTTGLIERCRPAHMLVVFTDGDDNMSSVYSDTSLGSIANNDSTVVIMLATSDAVPGVLETLAGDYGAVVQVTEPSSLVDEVSSWSASLNNIVKITLDQSIDVTGQALSISIGSQTVDVNLNTHCP